MKLTKVDLSEERVILSHCIADSDFLRQIHPLGNPELFESAFARTVGRWVWEFFEETGREEAPGKIIQEVYHRRKSEVQDEDELDLVQEYLHALSQDWSRGEVQNREWSVSRAIKYFKMRSMDRLRESLAKSITLKDVDAAEQALADFKRIDRHTGQRVLITKDAAAINRAFNDTEETLFEFPGALGKVVGPWLVGDFGAFFAPMKRGKSFWLKYAAYCAMRAGIKSLTVNLEMTLPQVTRRDWQLICASPKSPGVVRIPYFTEDGSIDWEDREMHGVPRTPAAIERVHRALKYTCRGGEMATEILPSRTKTVTDIKQIVRRYKTVEGMDLKLLVIDYADLLVAENSRLEGRQMLDWIWTGLRGLAQEENLCIITASQTGRLTLGRDARESDAAEDVRKLAHVTKAIMLNQSDIERKNGIMRVRCQMQREDGPPESEAVCLEQRSIGRCCLDSRFRSEVDHPLIGKWRDEKEAE